MSLGHGGHRPGSTSYSTSISSHASSATRRVSATTIATGSPTRPDPIDGQGEVRRVVQPVERHHSEGRRRSCVCMSVPVSPPCARPATAPVPRPRRWTRCARVRRGRLRRNAAWAHARNGRGRRRSDPGRSATAGPRPARTRAPTNRPERSFTHGQSPPGTGLTRASTPLSTMPSGTRCSGRGSPTALPGSPPGVGVGLSSSRQRMVMRKPGAQKAHWNAWALPHRLLR